MTDLMNFLLLRKSATTFVVKHKNTKLKLVVTADLYNHMLLFLIYSSTRDVFVTSDQRLGVWGSEVILPQTITQN